MHVNLKCQLARVALLGALVSSDICFDFRNETSSIEDRVEASGSALGKGMVEAGGSALGHEMVDASASA